MLVIVKIGGKLEVSSYAHLLNSCGHKTHDWFTVLSILGQLMTVIKMSHPTTTIVYLRSDEAGFITTAVSLRPFKMSEVVRELTLWDKIFRNHSTVRIFATGFYAR